MSTLQNVLFGIANFVALALGVRWIRRRIQVRRQFKEYCSRRTIIRVRTKVFPDIFTGDSLGGYFYDGEVVDVGFLGFCMDTNRQGRRWTAVSFGEIKEVKLETDGTWIDQPVP